LTWGIFLVLAEYWFSKREVASPATMPGPRSADAGPLVFIKPGAFVFGSGLAIVRSLF
jgi:hypothetical protein